MPSVRILSEDQLRSLVKLDQDVVGAIEGCFGALAERQVVMPPVMRLDIREHNGEVDVKSAYLPGLDSFAIKVSPGFFDNPKRGLPSLSGLMVLLSSKTGLLEALLLDNGYLTAIRTAAAGAVAAKWLSREESRTAGIIGAGEQARLQLEALTLVRPIERARVWARDETRAKEYAEEMSRKLGIDVQPAETPQRLAKESDIIVTTTPSSEPLLRGEWLEAGTHVTAMGSDAEHKNELDPSVLVRAQRYVADRLSQCRLLGELHHAVEAGVVPEDSSFPELGEIITGAAAGRSNDEQITVCDLTGTGAQDTAIAALAFARAVDSGAAGSSSGGNSSQGNSSQGQSSSHSSKSEAVQGSRSVRDHILGRTRPKKERA